MKNFYPRPPCGGRPERCSTLRSHPISIHVPLAGDDLCGTGCSSKSFEFLSTSPLRGTTACRPRLTATPNFYPRPPCGGRLFANRLLFLSTSPLRGTTVFQTSRGIFLSTSPLRGTTRALSTRRCPRFLSTSPLRGTTYVQATAFSRQFLSTSPLRGTTMANKLGRKVNFYPRPPCGGRRGDGREIKSFLSTSPLRGTTQVPLCNTCNAFLSTSPLRGTTFKVPWFKVDYFYPRPPCGGRRQGLSAAL